jgi:ABC-type transport system involved in multi-copper enzyme maturation permease subunit
MWKEWRQLRGVRWAGLLLGAVLLVILMASTFFGEPGSESSLGYRTPSLKEIALDTAPLVFGSFLWPLICLLSVVQAFTGDRASRCEEFLQLLPVSRTKAFFARLVAASASYVVSALMSATLLLLPTLLVDGEGNLARLGATLEEPARFQFAVLPLALAGGSAAAAFGISSFAALGLALTLGLFVLVSAGSLASTLFFLPDLRPTYLTAAFLAPGILMLLGSALWCTTRGEPAGHGAWKRALPLVLASLFVPPGLLLAANRPLAAWGEARSLSHFFFAPKAGHLSLERGSGAFIVDTRSAERIAFLPPWVSVLNDAFREDGQRLAVVQDMRLLGALPTARSALTLYDGEGQVIQVLDSDDLGCNPLLAGWAGDRLLTSCYDASNPRSHTLIMLDSEGRVQETLAAEFAGIWGTAGRDIQGRHLLCLYQRRSDEEWDTRLVSLDTETGTLGKETFARARGATGPFCAERLSPDGRYYLSDRDTLTDLRDGSLLPMPLALADADEAHSKLVAAGRILRLWKFRAGEKVKELDLITIESGHATKVGAWREDDWVQLENSPDRHTVLIRVQRQVGEEPNRHWKQVETWLLDVESAELHAVPVPAFDWAGPDVLAVNDGERLGLWRIGDPADAVKPLH